MVLCAVWRTQIETVTTAGDPHMPKIVASKKDDWQGGTSEEQIGGCANMKGVLSWIMLCGCAHMSGVGMDNVLWVCTHERCWHGSCSVGVHT